MVQISKWPNLAWRPLWAMKSIAITGMSLQLLRLNQPCRQGSVYFIGEQSKVQKLDDERALAGWI